MHVSLGVGEGVVMTPEVRATIERLLESAMATEGVAAPQGGEPGNCGTVYARCSTFSCQLTNCKPLKSSPCFQLVSCRVDV